MLPAPSMASSDSPTQSNWLVATTITCGELLNWADPPRVRCVLFECYYSIASARQARTIYQVTAHGAERLSDISVRLSHPSNAFCRHGLPSAVTVAPVQVSEPKHSAWRHLQAQGYSGEPLCSAWPAPLLPAGGGQSFLPRWRHTHTHPPTRSDANELSAPWTMAMGNRAVEFFLHCAGTGDQGFFAISTPLRVETANACSRKSQET